MKPVFFYLILIALFVAGMKLVNRQRQYTRSVQVLAQTETTGPATNLTTEEAKIPPAFNGSAPAQSPRSNEKSPTSEHYIPASH